MPLVCIALRRGKAPQDRLAIAEAIHRCMVSELQVPAHDRFQIITEHDPASLIYDPEYLGIERSDDIVIIQITLNRGRTLDAKRRSIAPWPRRSLRGPGFVRKTCSSTWWK